MTQAAGVMASSKENICEGNTANDLQSVTCIMCLLHAFSGMNVSFAGYIYAQSIRQVHLHAPFSHCGC